MGILGILRSGPDLANLASGHFQLLLIGGQRQEEDLAGGGETKKAEEASLICVDRFVLLSAI